MILMSEDRHKEAATIVEQSLQAALELNAMTLVVECLEILAASAVERDAGVAARMLAAAVRTRQELGEPGDQLLIELDDRTKAAARSRLPGTFDHHWDAGLALSLEDAVALALGERR